MSKVEEIFLCRCTKPIHPITHPDHIFKLTREGEGADGEACLRFDQINTNNLVRFYLGWILHIVALLVKPFHENVGCTTGNIEPAGLVYSILKFQNGLARAAVIRISRNFFTYIMIRRKLTR